MRLKFLPFLVAFFLQYGSAPSYGMELEEAFKDGQQFRRTQVKSPIYLQWSATSSEKNPSGFQVHSFKTKSKIGLVSTILDKKRESVDFSSFSIEDATLGSEVFRTLSGIFKASKNKLPPEIKYLCHGCSIDNKEIIDAAKEAGFMESQLYFLNPSQIYLVKPIPLEEPVLPQDANKTEVTLVQTNKPVISKPISNSIPHPLSTSNVSTVFEVGQQFQNKKSIPDIYLQYAAEIDIENVMEIPMKDFGFKVFRTSKKDEIGYIVPNYLPKTGEIRIGAVWINENMRRKEYASKALRTLISLYRAKKVHFPEAKCFSFYTTDNNKAMLKVAQKVEFEETASPDSQGLMSLFGGIFFKKPFDKQMPLPRTNQIISSDSNFNSISQSLITHDVTTLFNVGETFSGKSNAHIYLKYAAEIDIENVMKQPIKKFGFKIFRTLEKDEIGYIVPNYFVTPGCIDIEAVWINKDMRHKNYCSEAIMAFMSTYMSKKVYFPEAKYFSFFTTENNKAMHRVAQKVNFVHAIPSKEIKLMVLCGGRFFRKPFDNGK